MYAPFIGVSCMFYSSQGQVRPKADWIFCHTKGDYLQYQKTQILVSRFQYSLFSNKLRYSITLSHTQGCGRLVGQLRFPLTIRYSSSWVTLTVGRSVTVDTGPSTVGTILQVRWFSDGGRAGTKMPAPIANFSSFVGGSYWR